ncbi:MAG: DUF480 domain-containing protein [Phycisphaerales bacterium]|nr:DUF480 domain-containing protein [Phycisphaerales bacterium]
MTLLLTPDECRVLGVLVEKSLTTPAQYPLSLNGVVVGSNQKNNRDPLLNLDEESCLRALDGLRAKNLVREVSMTGSRVQKYRHVARDGLAVSTSELVLLAELLLRGPQTVGELRGRASRMHELESVEAVDALLHGLMDRPEPLVRRVAAVPGTRADRFAQLLCPDLHPIEAAPPVRAAHAPPRPSSADQPSAPVAAHALDELRGRVDRLEHQVNELHRLLESLTAAG